MLVIHIYVLYVHVPVVVDSVRSACMLQWKQMRISYLVTFLIIHWFEFSQQGFIVQVCKVLASALPLCCASVYVCVLICSLQALEPLIGLCKAVVFHHQRSLEEVVVGGARGGVLVVVVAFHLTLLCRPYSLAQSCLF